MQLLTDLLKIILMSEKTHKPPCLILFYAMCYGTWKHSSDSFELEEGYLTFPPNISVGFRDYIIFLHKPHHTYRAELSWLQQQQKYLQLFISFSSSSPLKIICWHAHCWLESSVSHNIPNLPVGHVAQPEGICSEQCSVDFTCSQAQGLKGAESVKGWLHKGAEHFGSKTGSWEHFQGDFFWLQLHAKLDLPSLMEKSVFLTEVINHWSKVSASLLPTAGAQTFIISQYRPETCPQLLCLLLCK